jgi:cephalosporin hydroxylase
MSTTPEQQFADYVRRNVEGIGKDPGFRDLSQAWVRACIGHNYAQNFTWLGRPVIQVPQDLYAVQELIWTCRPDLIIETGIAHGGSLVMSASILALMDYCDAIEAGATLDPKASRRKVVGVDIDIRAHNRAAIESHPMASRIQMFEGSSIDPDIVAQVREASAGYSRVMVCLDSMHTHAHVLAELEAYAPLVTAGCYCVVFDTLVEDMPAGFFDDRPWDVGDNPKTAVHEYLKSHPEFEIDRSVQNKLMVTVAPDGFLKRL